MVAVGPRWAVYAEDDYWPPHTGIFSRMVYPRVSVRYNRWNSRHIIIGAIMKKQMYRVSVVPNVIEVDVNYLDVSEYDKLARDPMFEIFITPEKRKLMRDSFMYAIQNGKFELIDVEVDEKNAQRRIPSKD